MSVTTDLSVLKVNKLTRAQYEEITPSPDEIYIVPDEAFTGTNGTTNGIEGLVPAPTTADAGKFLKADGTWSDIQAAIDALEARISALEGNE